ncbi:MAG: ATP-binding cassette domain-containing protein, partial [Cyanobacteria bacterium J083]
MKDKPILELKQVELKTALGYQTILEDINFQLFPGERLVIIGASGAGKTSLLRLLNRLENPTQGVIKFQGKNSQKVPILKLRRSVVLVPQESKLLGMKVSEAIAYPLILQKLANKTIQPRILTITQKLNIPSEWLEKTELELSLGQRQLVASARGLV